MSTWIYAAIALAWVFGPLVGAWWWRYRTREHPFDPERVYRWTLPIGRFLFEGRSRVLGELLTTGLVFAMALGGAWGLTQPHDKGANQMEHSTPFPGWLVYPLGIVASVAFSGRIIWDIEVQERKRRRRRRLPHGVGKLDAPTADGGWRPSEPPVEAAPGRTNVISEPDRSRTVGGTRWPPLPPR